jgi:mono/diheme cytochrome c family protein
MDAGVLARIVLHGVQGPIRVKGKTYVNEMPPLGEQLSDAEIASVLSYVRSSWGNSGGPVTPELVGQVRKTSPGQRPWTAESLTALAGAKQ